ncbi:MAG: hypothetical protein QM727_03230 [Niabella sp.]
MQQRILFMLVVMVCAMLLFTSYGKDGSAKSAKYTITLSADANGTATATIHGAAITLAAAPKEGYLFKKWTIMTGAENLIGDPAANPATFTMPAANVSLKAEFITDNVLTLIADPIFRAYAQKRMNRTAFYYDKDDNKIEHPKWDTDGNGKLSLAEAAKVVYINVSDSGVKSLSGIEHFTGLKILVCNRTQLTKLDVTKNTKLTSLSCSCNQLIQLDVTKNTELDWLDCSANQLTRLDLTNNTKLTGLDCYDNQLTQSDMTKNTELAYMICSNNQLTQLDITKNKNLIYLVCSHNRLKNLDVSKIADGKENDYRIYCGNQTANGHTVQIPVLTLRKNMKSRWETTLKTHEHNKNVEVK